MKDIDGIRPFPSRANLIFFSCAFDSDRIYKQLTVKGIVVKNYNNHPLMSNCIRVTVGNSEENTAFFNGVKKCYL